MNLVTGNTTSSPSSTADKVPQGRFDALVLREEDSVGFENEKTSESRETKGGSERGFFLILAITIIRSAVWNISSSSLQKPVVPHTYSIQYCSFKNSNI